MSKVIRRVHLYLALFLTPWLVMYALSTMAMNHRSGRAVIRWEPERQIVLRSAPPAGLTNPQLARWILGETGMPGAFNVNQRRPDGALIFTRQEGILNKRLTYSPDDNKVVIERQPFQWNSWLEKMHRRRGFQHDVPADDLWALIVDLVILAMITWILTGFWMWWEMKKTRSWGAGFLAAGCAVFALFLANG